MDLNKCRTCYTNLESNDLYLKLNVVNKNSTLNLADKLRKLIPVMNLKEADKLLICMQCSIHLETAYTFYTTCLETEEKFQKLKFTKSQSKRNCANEEKKDEMICETCNLHFSSKNIFDLHMKLMHFKKPQRQYEEVVNDINIRVAKNNKPLVEMVFLQTDLKKRRKDSLEDSSRKIEIKRRRVVSNKSDESNNDGKLEMPRRNSPRHKKRQNATETSQPKILETKVLVDRNSKQSTQNKIVATNAVTKQPSNIIEVKKKEINKKIRCKFCATTFISSEKMMRHVRISHASKCRTCPLCNRFYMNMKHHKKQYGCDLFNFRKQNFEVSDILSEITKDTGQTIYYMRSDTNLPICLICRRICMSVKCLEMHLNTKHQTDIRCVVCHKSFPAINYCSHMGRGCSKLISKHSFNYTSDGECICPICNQVFEDETVLKAHLVHHLYKKLQCPKCNEKFIQIVSYCQHVVKGCRKKKLSISGDLSFNEPMFVKCDAESNVETATVSMPLKVVQEAPSAMIELQSKNVKVEPTELLDQDGFVLGEDSLSGDNTTKFMNITRVNDEIVVDTPEFIYLVQNIDNKPSE